ncbi:MAG TPA: MBL fold metallo-hydrolase [Anaerolineaceae bacterium]|nr:MBL fold metallo-hydrolase [Anaerolineaceae bacterium]HNS36859.1 MBL fold metallo-hydrolase [Anaerolineaceae bacterium]
MKLTIYGAGQTVTGSQYVLEVNGQTLLLECGLYQGHRSDTFAKNLNFEFSPRAVDAAILSHAHIDHSGNLPNLVKQGYSGPIYVTPATAGLCELMLMDSAHIQESDVKFVNRKRERRGEPLIEPLYTQADAAEVFPLMVPTPYGQEFEPINGVTAHLVDAGHILGSSAVVLDVQENGRRFRFWFSGDIGRLNLPLLKDPILPERVDYLMMECTYGDKPHADPQAAYDELRTVCRSAIERSGKIIIPAFAVGRTQELVYYFNQMMTDGEIPKVPVYVDSPLAVNTTRVFQEYPDLYDEETWQFIRENRHPALNFPQLTYTQSADESKALNDKPGPMIIISASGMAETGRILHHLKNNIENPRNTVLIVGWQAPDTLGRRLAERAPLVKIFGETYQRRAEVVTIGGLSAHAGQNMLMQYARASQSQLRKIILVHGEPTPALALMEKFKTEQMPSAAYPEIGETLEI